MNFLQTALLNFKYNYLKYSTTTKQKTNMSTPTPLKNATQTLEQDAKNVLKAAETDVKSWLPEAKTAIDNDFIMAKKDVVTVGEKVASFIELSTETVIADIKSRITDLESIINKHSKAKTANLEKIAKLNAQNASSVAALQTENSSHDQEIMAATSLSAKLSPLVAIPSTTPATVTPTV